MEFHFCKLHDCKLQPSVFLVFKTSELMSPVDFLSAKTGANEFSTEKLL